MKNHPDLSWGYIPDTKGLKLLAEARKPPAVTPVVVAANDVHFWPATTPVVERDITQLAIGILPVATVGMFVGKTGVVFVDGGQRIGVGGLEAHELELFLQAFVTHEAVLVVGLGTRFEEDDFRLFTLTSRHGVHDCLIGVLPVTRSVQRLLRRAGAIDSDGANDHIADGFYHGVVPFFEVW